MDGFIGSVFVNNNNNNNNNRHMKTNVIEYDSCVVWIFQVWSGL
jgi:hypothetical protein